MIVKKIDKSVAMRYKKSQIIFIMLTARSFIMLYEHQKVAIRNCIASPRFALYHEQGLGKTISAILSADYYLTKNKSIDIAVVCPAFLQANWQAEIGYWSRFKDFYKIYSYNAFADIPTQYRVFKYLIIDEAHYIKNRRAKRTISVVSSAIRAERVVLLTGTPVGNRNIIDLYTHLVCLDPSHEYAKYRNFRERFVHPKRQRFEKERTKNEGEFLSILARLSERRLKIDCVDLPEKIYNVVPCQGSRVPKNLHVTHKMQLQDGILVKVSDPHTGETLETISSTSKKSEALKDLIECLTPEKQIVIYVAFKESMNIIKSLFPKIKIGEFHGNLSLAMKEKVLSDFRQNRFRILIATMQSMNVGVTLTNCCEVIYYSRTFSCTERAQSEDRFHRIGQRNCVNYYDLVANGVDKKAFEMIKANKSFDEIKKEIENAE